MHWIQHWQVLLSVSELVHIHTLSYTCAFSQPHQAASGFFSCPYLLTQTRKLSFFCDPCCSITNVACTNLSSPLTASDQIIVSMP